MSETIGFIGVGAMGGGMARNLLAAGYALMPFDLDPARLEDLRSRGATPAKEIPQIAAECDVVLMSLPKPEVSMPVAREQLLPGAREGQIFCEMGTVPVLALRELAEQFARRGATLLDAPVSGGPGGADQGRLRVFASGDPDAFARVRPVFQAFAADDGLTYCGPSGNGQIVKGVNQLMMGLANAAYAEALALGVRAGVPIETLRRAIGHTGRWRADFDKVAAQVAEGAGESIDTKMHQVPMFLEEAAALGQDLPLTDALWAFCRNGDPCIQRFGRMVPSFWRELMRGQ